MTDIDFRDSASFSEARDSLGAMLGLAEPAPSDVTRRALADPKYAMYLMMTRDSPDLRDKLLRHPQNRFYADAAPEPTPATTVDTGMTTIPVKAAGAIAKWALSGFKNADNETVAVRRKACSSCENLVDPPPNLLYSGLKLITGQESKICAACGCVAHRKAAMATASCPVADPDRPHLTRWGDPLPEQRRAAAG